MPRRAARWLHHRIGRRGEFLLIIGMGKTCWGISFLVAPPSAAGLQLLDDHGSLKRWAWLWIAAGLVTTGSALLKVGRDLLGFLVAMLPPAVWAVAYLTAAISGQYARGAFVALWYLTSHIGVIMWASTVPEHSVPLAPRLAKKGKAP